MADVYEAIDLRSGAAIALKVQAVEHRGQRWSSRRMALEAELLKRAANPTLPVVYDSGVLADGRYYIAMELLAGQTLREHLRAGPIAPAVASSVILQLLAAAEQLHRQGIAHCDLKPENIMLCPDGSLKLLDLGAAALIAAPGGERDVVIGTPRYMAPEQHAGRSLDERTDLYAIGLILGELVTGTLPFAGQLPRRRSGKRTLRLGARPGRALPWPNQRLGEGIGPAVRKATAPAPAHRFSSAAAMAHAISEHCLAYLAA